MFESLPKEVVEINVGQVQREGSVQSLETEVKGIGKCLDMQEFTNRSVVVGVVFALIVGLIKLFLPTLSS